MSSRANCQIYAAAGFAAIGGFLFGYDLGVISGVITMSNFLVAFGNKASLDRGSLTSAISGSIVGVMSIGCFIGALLAGQTSDRFSRKYSIVLFSVIFIISGALQAGSINLIMLLVSRLIAGKIMPCWILHYDRFNHIYRCECWCIIDDRTCLSIRNFDKRDSRTTPFVSTMGYNDRNRC
jgi:hypothetical protein